MVDLEGFANSAEPPSVFFLSVFSSVLVECPDKVTSLRGFAAISKPAESSRADLSLLLSFLGATSGFPCLDDRLEVTLSILKRDFFASRTGLLVDALALLVVTIDLDVVAIVVEDSRLELVETLLDLLEAIRCASIVIRNASAVIRQRFATDSIR